MLQFMGSQRVGHDWATELTELIAKIFMISSSDLKIQYLRQILKISSRAAFGQWHHLFKNYILDLLGLSFTIMVNTSTILPYQWIFLFYDYNLCAIYKVWLYANIKFIKCFVFSSVCKLVFYRVNLFVK